MNVILKKRLDVEYKPIIKEADIMAQDMEFKAFYKGGDIEYLEPWEAKSKFTRYFNIYLT